MAKAGAVPQAGLALYPGDRFEIGGALHVGDLLASGLGYGYVLSGSAAYRLPAGPNGVARLGVNVTADDRPWARMTTVGPLVGFEYALSERFAVFSDLTLGIALDGSERPSMEASGVGLVFRFGRSE